MWLSFVIIVGNNTLSLAFMTYYWTYEWLSAKACFHHEDSRRRGPAWPCCCLYICRKPTVICRVHAQTTHETGVWMFSGRCRLQSKKKRKKSSNSCAVLYVPPSYTFSKEKFSNRNLTKCAEKYKCLKIQFPISFKILSLLNKYKVQHTFRHGYKTKVSEHSPCSSCPATQSGFPSEGSSGTASLHC